MTKQTLTVLMEGTDLEEGAAHALACSIMDGQLTPSQIAALLVALHIKGESVAEITGFARAMRERAEAVPVAPDGLVDTCGTGGDGKGTFNVSTVCAFVAAGAGATVAKHGNRSASGRCGSAEVLQALGLEIEMGPRAAARSLADNGLAFLFAPLYHGAARHAALPRSEIGVRSIFNVVGPLTNPARVPRQLLGVFASRLTEPMAMVLRKLGSTHCMVVHGADGVDEISLSGPTRVSELRGGVVRTYTITPEDFGFERRPVSALGGADAATNARIALDVLGGAPGPAREIVLLNAGAALYVAGRAPSITEGISAARRSIDSSAAMARLTSMRASRAVHHA